MRAHRARNRGGKTRARTRRQRQHIVFLLELNFGVQLERQLAVAAFQRDDIAVLLELNAFRQLNRFFCNS